jgi:hypothetical protein
LNEWKSGTNTDFSVASAAIAALSSTAISSTSVSATNINASAVSPNTIGTAGQTTFYGNGAALTGISSGGVIGVEALSLFNEIGKIRNSYINTLSRSLMHEPFCSASPMTRNYRISSATSGSKTLVLNSTDVTNYGKPTDGETYRLVDISTGNLEDIVVDSFSGSTITTVSNLIYSYDAVSPDYCYSESGVRGSAQNMTHGTTTGTHGKQIVWRGQMLDVGAKVGATIYGDVVYNTQFQYPIATVNAGAGTFTMTTNSDVSAFISSSSPYDKLFLQKVFMATNGEISCLNNGREYTVTSSSYGAPTLTVGVSSTYTDFDDGTTQTDGLTDVAAPTADGNTYWICVKKSAIPKYSFVNSGADESYQAPTIKRVMARNTGISYPSYVHSHWKMNALSGNEPNWKTTGGTYDLTQVGTVPSAPGKLGLSRGVFSTSNYFRNTDSLYKQSSSNMFIDFWFKTSTTGTTQQIITNNAGAAGYQIYISTSNKIQLDLNGVGGYLISTNTVTDGIWHHCCVAMLSNSGSNNCRMYVDGALTAGNTGASFLTGLSDLLIGVSAGITQPFQGQIDSVAFATTAPTVQAEMDALVSQRYAGGAGREYGFNVGTSIIMQESSKAGQLFRPQVELVRNSTSCVDTIESAGYIISGD